MTTFAKCTFRCSAPAAWNSLRTAVLNSDSVAVFESKLKTFLFPGFLFFLCSLTGCLASALIKLRPYTYTCLYLYVDGLEGVGLKCPHPHQNVVSIVETLAFNIYPVYS